MKEKDFNRREENGVIYISKTSDGTDGPAWITRLERGGYLIGEYVKSLLLSKDFKPTTGVTYEIAILRGESFSDSDRFTRNIRREASKHKLITPNPELACLSREALSNQDLEDMGLAWILIMHEPIKDFDDDPRILGLCRSGAACCLGARHDFPDLKLPKTNGFLFVFFQVKAP